MLFLVKGEKMSNVNGIFTNLKAIAQKKKARQMKTPGKHCTTRLRYGHPNTLRLHVLAPDNGKERKLKMSPMPKLY